MNSLWPYFQGLKKKKKQKNKNTIRCMEVTIDYIQETSAPIKGNKPAIVCLNINY